MASISERVRAGGRKVYLVQIIRRSLGNYRDSQTFSNRAHTVADRIEEAAEEALPRPEHFGDQRPHHHDQQGVA